MYLIQIHMYKYFVINFMTLIYIFNVLAVVVYFSFLFMPCWASTSCTEKFLKAGNGISADKNDRECLICKK